jgi:hypothetical protein
MNPPLIRSVLLYSVSYEAGYRDYARNRNQDLVPMKLPTAGSCLCGYDDLSSGQKFRMKCIRQLSHDGMYYPIKHHAYTGNATGNHFMCRNGIITFSLIANLVPGLNF